MKQLLLTSTILALSALPLNAQEVAKSGYFANVVKNIGNALNTKFGQFYDIYSYTNSFITIRIFTHHNYGYVRFF